MVACESLQGGTATGAYQFVQEQTIPDDTCQQYKAVDDECSAENTCRNCKPWGEANCFAVTDYRNYTVTEYGRVSSPDKMVWKVQFVFACRLLRFWLPALTHVTSFSDG